jgi:cyclopropane fatty-acyl-phospholipid synthase-like methyltransferase
VKKYKKPNFSIKKFDAIISIGFVFLLSEKDQELFFKKISNVLKLEGRFLFTAPTQQGKRNDLNTGIECYSLGFKKVTKYIWI